LSLIKSSISLYRLLLVCHFHTLRISQCGIVNFTSDE
jgi:hypothetical protein